MRLAEPLLIALQFLTRLPVSLAGLAFTLYAYGWPIPVAGCAVLVGIAIGVLLRERN